MTLLIVSGCNIGQVAKEKENLEIILATTTSTYDSGLLDELIPPFEDSSGYLVKIVSVGTGKALEMGREGNADILLVHAPSAEKEFMGQGFGIERELIMHNDFIIVGPLYDPAGIRGFTNPLDALKRILETESPYISRGDDSGTHKKELDLWKGLNSVPAGDWYLESGQGMGATLQIASEKEAYSLTDRGTYLSLLGTMELELMVEGDMSLLNIYHIIIVNPEIWPEINLIGARDLACYLVSVSAQEIIENFGMDLYGQPLFFPDAGKSATVLGMEE